MRTALALLLLSVPLATQTSTERPPAPALHRGWLLEMLDGDREGAAKLYTEAADDQNAPIELRAVALARLVELERLKPDPQRLDGLVRELRQVIDELGMPPPSGFRFGGQPVPWEGLADAARAGEEELTAWLDEHRPRRGRGPSRPYHTRPLVSFLYEDLVAELSRARSAGNDATARRLVRELRQLSSRNRMQRRGRIVQILKLTLEGRHEQAARLRRRSDLRRQVRMPEDPIQALQVARTRLDGELARVGLNPEERRALRSLQERLLELSPEGATDEVVLERATEAVELLRGLPVYGELLLGDR